MHNLTTMTGDDVSSARTEYATRVLKVDHPEKVLPFVRAVLQTVGDGSAHVVPNVGILLTAPIGVSHFLDSVVVTDLKTLDTEFEHATVYAPSLNFAKEIDGDDLLRIIGELKLVPPDMNSDWIQVTPDRGVLFVSGPPSRNPHFTKDVLPSLNRLMQLMEKPGFPAG